MHRSVRVLAVCALAVLALVVPTSAGPEKIAFPGSVKSHVLYTTVDRYDIKQYRELYASSQEAVQAMKDGKPLPYGTVLTLIQYKAQLDAQAAPLKDANGRFVRGDLIGYTVMEKRQGWGAEYPADLRNGEWEYAAFSPDGKLNEKANYKACFQCHKPHEKQDFVISLAKLRGAVAAATSAADVTIAGFAFGPSRLTVAPGKPVTWLNTDDSPHQIVVTSGTGTRSDFLVRGQSHSQAFAAPGVYDYMCGLHPSMKGQIEVK
ncbi:MAG: cytochrome P460 family protein [Candidatus Rokubacteria bacterium]|nr:cytochrome P460 family protein [Candidatus Rokubacteria bacterium]